MNSTTATPAATTKPVSRENEFVQRSVWKSAVLGALSGLALVLAARFVLLVAVAGAIALTFLVVASPDPWRLAALGVYALTVVMPAMWLASRR